MVSHEADTPAVFGDTVAVTAEQGCVLLASSGSGGQGAGLYSQGAHSLDSSAEAEQR